MKRHNIRTARVYLRENGKNITKYAVQVRLKGRQNWIQAKKGETPLIFNTEQEAEQIIIDYMSEVKKTICEKINDGKVKVKIRQ